MMGQQGPAMPPGMEGMPPFPQGGAEQAPPTPDGMPPLRAAGGTFVDSNARASGNPLYMPDWQRWDELTSGRVPEEEMTPDERSWLRSYKYGMGFTGGSIRDVASQGMGRIRSALSPYVQRGINYVDELVTPFLRPGMRVEPMVEGGRRAVIQGRENIVQGSRGAEMGAGTRLQGANTLNVGRVPFSQAVRENPLLNRVVREVRQNPKLTALGTGIAATDVALYNQLTSPSTTPRSAEELAQVNALINQIPGQGPPLRDATGRMLFPGGAMDVEGFEAPPERPEDATINRARKEDLFSIPFKPEAATTDTAAPPPPAPPATNQDLIDKLDEKKGEEKKYLTRAERIKAEYGQMEPLFRELLGDTKSHTRMNALLLLADAGFKYASATPDKGQKRTELGMLSKALSGVPQGFAAIVAEARNNDIKIKSSALQQAVSSIDMQDKIARDVMLANMKNNASWQRMIWNANSRRELEEIKHNLGNNAKLLEAELRDQSKFIEWQREYGTPKAENIGGGYIEYSWKNGITQVRQNPDSNIPADARNSRFAMHQVDNPYVINRGQSPMTRLESKDDIKSALHGLAQADMSLRDGEEMVNMVQGAFSPKTWAIDKYNHYLVPISFGALNPNIDKATLVAALKLKAESLKKNLAGMQQTGRISNQNIQSAEIALGDIMDPDKFLKNPETAAASLSALMASLRNSRQGFMEQLGYEDKYLVATPPAMGTPNSPFVYGQAGGQQAQIMDTYLKNLYRGQDPNIPVYVNINGETTKTSVGNILNAR